MVPSFMRIYLPLTSAIETWHKHFFLGIKLNKRIDLSCFDDVINVMRDKIAKKCYIGNILWLYSDLC